MEALAWQPGTASFTPSVGTTPRPRLCPPASVTVWRGESTPANVVNDKKSRQISGLTVGGWVVILLLLRSSFQSGSFPRQARFCLLLSTHACVLCACRYDPQTDVWTAVAPMSISRDAVGVCLLGDRLFAVGGYDGQVYLSTVEAYDPQTNEWTQVCTQKPRYTKKVDPQKSRLLISVCSFSSSSRVLAMFWLLCKCDAASCKCCLAAAALQERGDKMELSHSSQACCKCTCISSPAGAWGIPNRYT